MPGAIAGDIIGSICEGRRNLIKRTDFPLVSPRCHFTGDTVLTAAVAPDTRLGEAFSAGYGPQP